MSFTPSIAEQALLDCGRHCCLCHKFCGTKIEIHHITPGIDTAENCIPLCFDCHADVKTYNSKHPKGKKYTESELQKHRDNWHKKVGESHGTTISPEHANLDKELFIRFKNNLPSDGSISFIRHKDFGAAFNSEDLNDTLFILDNYKHPEFEFLDTDLEGLKAELVDYILKFRGAIGKHTYPLEGNKNLNKVPTDWSHGTDEQQEYYHACVSELNTLADRVCETYDKFIRLGRRKLGV